jgi:glycogen synthase
MRVLFWSEGFLPHMGGVEIFAKHIIQGLTQRGFEFAVITSIMDETLEEEDYLGAHIYRLPLRPGLNGNSDAFRTSLKKIAEIKRSFKPHLSHINTTGPTFIYHLQTKAIHPHPSLFTFHFYPPSTRGSNVLLNRILDHCIWVNTVAQDPLQAVRNYAPNIITKSSYIYNALELPPVDPKPLPWNPPVLLGIGRMVHEKGFDLALKAMTKLLAKYPGLKLNLVGTGPADDKLKELAERLRIEESINFLGHLSKEELYQVINEATLLLVPSRHLECFGLVALEAMQLCRPVIGAQSGGLTEVIINGETGLVVPQDDFLALSEGIDQILSQPANARAMGLAGRERTIKEFSLKRMLNEYEKLFQKLLS